MWKKAILKSEHENVQASETLTSRLQQRQTLTSRLCLMHRNVARQLLRQRQQCAPLAINVTRRFSLFGSKKPTTSETSSDQHGEQDTSSDDIDAPTGGWRADLEEVKRKLQDLDQKALLETKIRLNALIKQYEDTKTSIPKLVPSEIRAAPSSGNEHPIPYILSAPRTLQNTLPGAVAAATNRARHVRLHIEDLQTADYIEPGDGLAAWKEEVEGMTTEEKRDKLNKMRLEEEAELNRQMASAQRNLDIVRKLSGKGIDAPAGVSGRKEVKFVEGGEKEGGGERKASGGMTKAINIGRAREKALADKAQEAEKPAEKPAEENSLLDLQRRLTDMMGGSS